MTKAEKYNNNLENIFRPEVKRLEKREIISKNILARLNEKTNIDYCGLSESYLINTIGKEIDSLIK
jgi:hypothetical protein